MITSRRCARGSIGLPSAEENDLFAYGAPASPPLLHEMWPAWDTITRAADPWLDALTLEKLAIRQMLGHAEGGSHAAGIAGVGARASKTGSSETG